MNMFGDDDLASLLSSTFTDAGGEEEADDPPDQEHEFKFDPTTLKTELLEDGERNEDDDPLGDDDFFSRVGDGNGNQHSDGAEEDTLGRRRSGRKRKPVLMESYSENLSDLSDTEKSPSKRRGGRSSNRPCPASKKKFKEEPVSESEAEVEKTAKPKRRQKKMNRNSGRPKASQMTKEEREKWQAKWRDEAKKKRARRRLENDLYLDSSSGGEETDDAKKKKPRRSRSTRSSTCGGGTRRPKASDMTPEEREKWQAKWREEARRKRERYKIKKDQSAGSASGDDGSGPGTRRSSSGGRKGGRPKVSEMTDEERDKWKAKWREEARLKRQRQKERMTPQEREEYLRKNREDMRFRRALQKSTMTPEELEEFNKKNNGRKYEVRSQLTPEQKREASQRVTMRRIERLAKMTDEERAERKINNYMSYLARMSKLTPEEIEERKKKRREYAQKKQQVVTDEDKEKRRQRVRQYRYNMDPDRRERFLRNMRESYKRRKERLQAEGKWDEVKEKWRREGKEKKRLLREKGIKGKPVKTPRRYPNETPEERKERIKEQNRKYGRRSKMKKKLQIQQMLEKGMSLEEISRTIETPEERERRLIRHRVNKAKREMRKRLVSAGAPPDEIQAQLDLLAVTYQPTRDFRPYKPRVEAWKPLNEEELNLLNEPETTTTAATTNTTSTTKPAEKVVCVDNKIIATLSTSVSSTAAPSTTFRAVGSSSGPSTSQTVDDDEKKMDTLMQSPETSHYPSSSADPSHLSSYYPYNTFQTGQAPPQFQSSLNNPPQQQGTLSSIYNSLYQSASVSTPCPPQASHFDQQQHPHSTASDYGSSYDPGSPPSSPPPTPGAELSFPTSFGAVTDFYRQTQMMFPPHQPQPGPSSSSMMPIASSEPGPIAPTKGKKGRPRKGFEKPKVEKKPRTKLGVPYGALHKNVKRDAVCDECGNAYNSGYINEHKRNFHNPHYKNGQCILCGEKILQTRLYWKHFKERHPELVERQGATAPNTLKKHMCEGCGRGFSQEGNMRQHWYYAHGPGSQPENFPKCPLCPGEKRFKNELTFKKHLRQLHPEHKGGVYNCVKCSDSFRVEPDLFEHIKTAHPDSYWPCKYCSCVKYTEMTLRFHYSKSCAKIPREDCKKMREEFGLSTLDRLQTACEFCERKVCLMNLRRHYWEMHGVVEDKFPCFRCDKLFKRREYLGAHMVDYHDLQPAVWIEEVRKLNVKDRTKVDIQNLKGEKGGAPYHNYKLTVEGTPPKRNWKKKPREVSGSDGESEPEKKKPKKQPVAKKKTAKEGQPAKRRGRPKKKKTEESDNEYEPRPGRRSGRTTRKRYKEVMQSDTEDDDDDDGEAGVGENDRGRAASPGGEEEVEPVIKEEVEDPPPEESD